MPATRKTTLRVAIFTNLAPIGVFTFAILVATVVVLVQIASWTDVLSAELHAEELSEERIAQVGHSLRLVWLYSLGAFLVFSAVTVALSSWVFQLVRRRLETLVSFVEARMAGREVESIAGSASGPLAALENSIERVMDNVETRNAKMERDAELNCLDTKLQRALDLVDSEEEALEVIELALSKIIPDVPAEVLLADSSRAHLHRRAANIGVKPPGCSVASPGKCSAVRRGTTLAFGSSQDLDACPRLRERDAEDRAALCTPLNVMGRTIGVLHLTHPTTEPILEDTAKKLEVLATHTGTRLGMLRTLASTQLQAQTDPLTGLMNRRSFEAATVAAAQNLHGVECAVAMADLDHFKRLNDTAGHEAGDRALKLFASVVKDNLRPGDLVGRHGGEEFTFFLMRCDAEAAKNALERIRQALKAAVERYGGPTFTCSFGVSCTRAPLEDLGPLLERADRMLYAAKEAGRDRIVTDADDLNALSETDEKVATLQAIGCAE